MLSSHLIRIALPAAVTILAVAGVPSISLAIPICGPCSPTLCTNAACISNTDCSITSKPAGTSCGGSDSECDAVNTCDGAGNCIDNIDPAGSDCRAAGTCDVAETCDGASKSCPADTFAPEGTPCSGGECDAAGTCVAIPIESGCAAKIMRAASKKASIQAKCYAKGFATGEFADDSCLGKAASKFATAMAKAAESGCTVPTADEVSSVVDDFLDALRSTVVP